MPPWTLVCTPGGLARPPVPAGERTGNAETVVLFRFSDTGEILTPRGADK